MCHSGQEVRRQQKTNAALSEEWARRHGIYYHDLQAKIMLNPGDSRCLQLGMCVCGQHEESSPDSWFLSQNVRHMMAEIFRKQKSQDSQERLLLQGHAIVLRCAANPDPPVPRTEVDMDSEGPATDIWLQPGHVHFGNWNFTAVQLEEEWDSASHLTDETVRVLQALSHYLDPTVKRVRTATRHYKELLDFDKPWWLSIWRISEVELHWPEGHSSEAVPVVACCEPRQVWRGTCEEAMLRQTGPKTAPSQSAAGQQRTKRARTGNGVAAADAAQDADQFMLAPPVLAEGPFQTFPNDSCKL